MKALTKGDIDRTCLDCRCDYSPCVQTGGKMPRGYKTCPKCKSKNTKTVNEYVTATVKSKLEERFGKKFIKQHVEII